MKKVLFLLIFLVAAAVTLNKVSSLRTFQAFGDLIQRVETGKKVVALTFDDGPQPEFTRLVLATLKAHDVKATFFLTGREMQQHPEVTRSIVVAGHQLGNHSFSHSRLIFCRPSAIREELESTDKLIRAAGWAGDIVFRPPYGRKLLVLPWVLAQTNRRTIMWDVESERFDNIPQTAAEIASLTIAHTRPGSIILLHPQYASRHETRQALPQIITTLTAQGYAFVTVQELLRQSS